LALQMYGCRVMQVNDDKMLCLLQKYCISVKAHRCSYCCCFVAVASQVLSLALQMYGCRVMQVNDDKMSC